MREIDPDRRISAVAACKQPNESHTGVFAAGRAVLERSFVKFYGRRSLKYAERRGPFPRIFPFDRIETTVSQITIDVTIQIFDSRGYPGTRSLDQSTGIAPDDPLLFRWLAIGRQKRNGS